MSYCLNPGCEQPLNPDGISFCQSCGIKLIPLLRNRYRIIRLIGGGGFGRTFLAEDEDKLNEPCVVKQLVPQVQGTSAILKATQLFEQEARRLQQLGEHPQIPTLYAYFEQDDYLYLVQQLIVGQNLRQEVEQHGSFSEEKIWELLSDLLPVLKFVHEQQVIHRDIKPENIIRRQSDGKLVLIDFGIAKQVTLTAIAKPGTTIGSFGYASIEQMHGGEVYPASDLYSLGVTCFYVLTGVHPSRLWAEYGYNWVIDWRQYLNNRQISQELDLVIDKLLQKDVQRRYHFVDEVLQGLNYQTSLLPESSSPSITQLPPSQIVDANSSQTTIHGKQESLWRSPFNQLFTTIAAPKKLKNKLIVLSSFILLLGLAGYKYLHVRRIPTLTGHSGEVNAIAFSPDGQTLASASDDRTIKIWNLNAQQELRTLKGHLDWVYSLAISPDGKTVVSGSKDNTVKVWNLHTGQQLRNHQIHQSFVNSVAISPDSQKIASGSYDKTIKIWNLNLGQVMTLTGHLREVLSVAISPNAQKLVSSSTDKTIKVWNLNTGKELITLRGHSGDVNALAISPNSQDLVSVSDDKTIKVWNLNTGQEIRTFMGHSADVNTVAFNSDGKTIATGSDDKTIKLWNLSTGEELRTLTGHLGSVFAVAFSPDGQTLISGSADKTLKIWRVNRQ